MGGEGATSRPMTFFEAITFQAVNVKAWTMSFGAFATYATQGELIGSVVLIAGMFLAVGLPCSSTWTAFGAALKQMLSSSRAHRTFNIAMALLLIASLAPTVAEVMPTLQAWPSGAWLIGGPCGRPLLA